MANLLYFVTSDSGALPCPPHAPSKTVAMNTVKLIFTISVSISVTVLQFVSACATFDGGEKAPNIKEESMGSFL